MKKKLVYASFVAVLLFGSIEIGLRLARYDGDPRVVDFRYEITSELFGEPDPVRFWRLPNLAPRFDGEGARIICLADSVTVMEHGRGWPDLLAPALVNAGYTKPVQVFNAGVPGYTSYQGLRYLETELLAARPQVVTVQFGWNDHWPSPANRPDREVRTPGGSEFAAQRVLVRLRFYRLLRSLLLPDPDESTLRVPLEDYRKNLVRIAELVRGQGGQVMFISPVFLDNRLGWRELHLLYVKATRDAAFEAGVPLLDQTEYFAARPDLFLEPWKDKCHINHQGAEVMARAAADLMLVRGLLP